MDKDDSDDDGVPDDGEYPTLSHTIFNERSSY